MSTKPPPKKAAARRRRDYGTGQLVDLGNGSWKLVVAFVAPDGRRRHRARRFKGTRTEASVALAALIADIQRGAMVYDDGLTYAQLVESFLAAKAVSQESTTVALYKRTLETHVVPIIGKVRLRDLTAAHITRVIAGARNASRTKQRGEQLGSTSRRNLRIYIRATLQHAYRLGFVVKNVCDQVEVPKSEHVERVDITVDVASAIMTAVRRTKLEALVIFSLGTGARRGETCGLRWSDVDLTTGRFSIRRAAKNVARTVVVDKPKTRGSERSDLLPDFALDALQDHRRRQREQDLAFGIRRDDGYVFRPGISEQGWDPNEVSRSFSRVVRRKKLPVGLRWHDLRHGFATLAFAAGVPLEVISKALGHSSIALTSKLYVHLLDASKYEKSKLLDAYLRDALRDPAV